MNIFRLAGDSTHLISVIVLLMKIYTIKSCAGISLKTQELYALVFATRYLDLFTDYISLYNSVMKLIFLGSSFSIVWYIRYHKVVQRSYDRDHDTFRHYFLVIACFILALFIHEKLTFREIMWTFSLYLEVVAIIPQLVLLQRTKNIDNLTGNYVFFLGAYRFFYILNWIYRYYTEAHYGRRRITWVSGFVQTLLYADFFYYYVRSTILAFVCMCLLSAVSFPSCHPRFPFFFCTAGERTRGFACQHDSCMDGYELPVDQVAFSPGENVQQNPSCLPCVEGM